MIFGSFSENKVTNQAFREYQEMADLQFILSLPGVDKEEIKGYFESYGLEGEYEELAKKIRFIIETRT